MYSDKSFSERAATAMLIGSSILIVPAAFGLLFSGLILIAGILNGKFAAVAAGAPFLITGAGVWMLVGYYAHRRRELSSQRQIALWIGTLIFNLVPLVPSILNLKEIIHKTPLFVPFVLWWAFACLASVVSLIDDHYVQKYR